MPSSTPSARSDVVGVRLARGGRRRARPSGAQLVAEQGDVERGRADRCPGTRAPSCDDAEAADLGDAGDGLDRRRARPASMRLRRNEASAVDGVDDDVGRAGPRTAPVEPRIRPSSRPPRNISSMAISVRMTVAVTKRPGRRRSSRSASLIGPPPPRWWPRSGSIAQHPPGRERARSSTPSTSSSDRPERRRRRSRSAAAMPPSRRLRQRRVERDAEREADPTITITTWTSSDAHQPAGAARRSPAAA